MTAPTFTDLVPCPRCRGVGEIRHQADRAEVRERARRRRRGEAVDPPPAMDPCPRCEGTGYLPPAIADAGQPEPPPSGLWALTDGQ